MHTGSDSLQQPAQGPGAGCGDTQQPESDLHEWDSYVEYINRKVIQEPAEITADSTGLQGKKPILSLRHVRSNSTHTERFAQNRDKKIQAELSAQLAQAEAAVGVFSFLSNPSDEDTQYAVCFQLHGPTFLSFLCITFATSCYETQCLQVSLLPTTASSSIT
jgi:hypothetical protein